MKHSALAIALLSSSAALAATATSSHCGGVEQVIYSCQIKESKVVSLCASTELNKRSGYLQYRFGRLGSVELEFPNEKKNSQKQFLYAHYFRYQTDRAEVSFKNRNVEYVLYSYYEGEEKPAKSETGIRVKNTSLPCVGPAINNLSTLKDVISCDEGNSLGGCK